METPFHDLRYALRQLRRNPEFTAVAILTLALGIGSTTGMFSVIRAVLLKPLAYRDPERVVVITDGATPGRFEELKAASRSYTEIGAFAGGFEDFALSGVGEPEVLKGARVSANFLDILGVPPLRGRSFRPDEDKPGTAAVAMIAARLWRQRFGGEPSIVGKVVTLAGVPYTIIGVLPAGFQFPLSGAEVWVTKPSEWSVISTESRPLSPTLNIFARLKADVKIQLASAELRVLNQQYRATHPGMLDAKKADMNDVVRPLREVLVSDVRAKLWMLFGAVGFVLLIVCANLASLLLARATSRSREFAVRAAIGAGRGRIIGQLLAESVLLAFLGGAPGVALAAASLRGIRSMTFIDLPRVGEIRMDSTVFGFAVALSIVTGMLFGLVPSLIASRPDLAAVLRGSSEGSSAWSSMRIFGPRGVLVAGQVALSIVLLIGATLLIESLAHLYRVDPGFQPANLLTMNIPLSPARYDTDAKRAAFYEELVRRAESLPGVRSAAVTLTLPMMDTWLGTTLQLVGKPLLKLNERPIGIFQNVTPDYFRTLGTALKRGRQFSARDNTHSVPVAIISENLARLFWPQYPSGPDPIGDQILFGSNPEPKEIVGIAADVRQSGRDEDPMPEVYVPCLQQAPQSAIFAVRTSDNPLSFTNAVRSQVLAIDRDQPASGVTSMDALVEASEGQLRLITRLLVTFAVVAMLIATVGLYGIVSFAVLRRRKEIGIRCALGARRSDVLVLVIAQGLGLSLIGVLVGVSSAFALGLVMRELLFHVSATDPKTFMGVSILFVAVGTVACYIPARRATRIDPVLALRYE